MVVSSLASRLVLKQTVLDRPGRRVLTTSFLELSERIWERDGSSQCREAEVNFSGQP